jgi:hypothetical protein
VNVESARPRRRQIGVDLHGMRQHVLEFPAEVEERLPVTVKRLQDDGRSIAEVGVDAPCIDEVVYPPRLHASGLRVGIRRERLAFLHQPQGRVSEAPFRQNLVDVGKGQQVVEVVGARGPAIEGRLRPIIVQEGSGVTYTAF